MQLARGGSAPLTREQSVRARVAARELRLGAEWNFQPVLHAIQELHQGLHDRGPLSFDQGLCVGLDSRAGLLAMLTDLERDLKLGRLMVVDLGALEPPLVKRKPGPVPEPPVPPRPPPVDKLTFFEVRLVDEVGESIGGVEVEFEAGDRTETLSTNPAGVATLEGVISRSATASVVGVAALDRVLSPRWEKERVANPPSGVNTQCVVFKGARISGRSLKAAVPNTIVITPPEVNLRLTFVDPAGKVRRMPEGLPVTIVFDDAQELTQQLDQESAVRFVTPRGKKSFYVRIVPGAEKRFITADPKELGAPELVTLSDALTAAERGRVFFQLPAEFDTVDGYWKAPASVEFEDGRFLELDDPSTQIGRRTAPAELRLEVRWQHLRFEYFDRFTSSETAVPQTRTQGQPMLVLEGFPNSLDPNQRPSADDSEARSVWDLGTGDETVHCLGWVRRLPSAGSGALVELPDAQSTTRFQFNGAVFVRTEGTDARDAVRSLVPVSNATSTPGVERLRFYDLPENWLSTNYPARRRHQGIQMNRSFQTLVAAASSARSPYLVPLDIIVLENEAGNGPDGLGWDDQDVEKRHAIYDHELRVHEPDTISGEPYFTRLKRLKRLPEGPVLHDFPEFTRLIARGPVLFDVFDRRTPWTADFNGFPIGARFATRYINGTNGLHSAFFVLSQFGYSVPEPDGSHGTSVSNEATLTALLRCCGRDGNTERIMFFQYMSVHFDFQPTASHPGDGRLLATPPTGDEAVKHERRCLVKVDERWNGKPVTLRLEGDEPAIGGFRLLLTRAGMPAGGVPTHPQVLIRIYDGGRASQNGAIGHWAFADMSFHDVRSFTGAHELGHAMSMPDEYFDKDDEPSLGEINIVEAARSPGTPYGFDGEAMMTGGERRLRARYFWHLVLWARSEGSFSGATKVTISQDKQQFSPALTPRGEDRVKFPAAFTPDARGAAVGTLGFCDLFLYSTGHDGFTAGALGGSSPRRPYDGFITARVKLACTFLSTDDFREMRSSLIHARAVIHLAFNVERRLVVRGTFDGQPVSLRVLFRPCFICRTFPTGLDSVDYLGTLDPALTSLDAVGYAARVEERINEHRVHAEVNITREDVVPGVIGRNTPFPTPRIAWVREMLIEQFDDDMALCFARLVGLESDAPRTPNEYRPLLAPLAPRLQVTALEFVHPNGRPL